MKKILLIALLLALSVGCLWGATAFADEISGVAVANLDKTDVLADLMTSEDFDIEQYNFTNVEASGTPPQLMSFVEYCYSPILSYSSLYRLYIYMYNPGGHILAASGHSCLIATNYINGKPSQYETFELELVDISDNLPGKDTRNMFWKFRVVDHVSVYDGLTIQQRVNTSARRYDVASIQLARLNGENLIGDNRVNDYRVGCIYTYTGFATDMSYNSQTPLQVTAENLDTVSLEVHNTYYRTATSSKGEGFHNDINAVYFSVPKDYFTHYGDLKRIKAEWYEFVTQDIIVTSDAEFYDAAQSFVGKDASQRDTFGNFSYGLVENYTQNDMLGNHADWDWNFYKNSRHLISCPSELCTGLHRFPYNQCKRLMWLFNTDCIQNYNPNVSLLQQGGISAETLFNYALNFPLDKTTIYSPMVGGFYQIPDSEQIVNIAGLQLNKNLFRNSISEDRLINNAQYGIVQCGLDGKSTYEFDADINFLNFETWDWNTGSFWENSKMLGGDWWNALWGNYPEQEEALSNILCIETVLESDLRLTQSEFCQKYLINNDDYDNFIAYCQQQFRSGNEVVLFRFAVTDYYSNYVDVYKTDFPLSALKTDIEAYRAWGSVFLNFDVIQLTFKNSRDYTALAVVSDPVNILPDVQPPTVIESPGFDSTWVQLYTLIFTILAAFIVLVVVIGTMKYLFS